MLGASDVQPLFRLIKLNKRATRLRGRAREDEDGDGGEEQLSKQLEDLEPPVRVEPARVFCFI